MKVSLGLAVTLPRARVLSQVLSPLQPGGPEPAGGAGGSASPPGGAPARSGRWRAPPHPHPAQLAHGARLHALVLFQLSSGELRP